MLVSRGWRKEMSYPDKLEVHVIHNGNVGFPSMRQRMIRLQKI
jgi:hypothetical protein